MIADGYMLIAPPNADFADVAYGSAFYNVIETAYQNGIISGYGCGTTPSEPCDAQRDPYFPPEQRRDARADHQNGGTEQEVVAPPPRHALL